MTGIFRKIFGGSGGGERSSRTSEEPGPPVELLIEGFEDESGTNLSPFRINHNLGPNITRITSGRSNLHLIAKINRGMGIRGIDLVGPKQVKNGTELKLPDSISVAIPYVSSIFTSDGRLYIAGQFDSAYLPDEKSFKLDNANTVRLFIKSHEVWQ